jgi:hypothetical protein
MKSLGMVVAKRKPSAIQKQTKQASMKKTTKLILGATIAGLVTFSAGATTLLISKVPGYGSGSFSGGEFNAYSTDDPAFNSAWQSEYASVAEANNPNNGHLGFETFCLELHEPLSSISIVQKIQQNAVYGGVGPAGDPISLGTAWLYYNFAKGLLSDYDYTPGAGRVADAMTFQYAIWELENEVTLTSTQIAANKFLQDVITQFGSLVNAQQDNNGLYHVAAMNLLKPDGSRAQDMLILVPDGGTTVILLGLALGGLVFARRLRVA